MKKIAVILSGCGYLDGAEIRESVLTLLSLDLLGVDVEIFAPDENQFHTMDHFAGKENTEQRNMLKEAARIARGKIQDIKKLDTKNFDGLVFPGGFGVAKNLCNFAFKGRDFTVNDSIDSLLCDFHSENKPIAAICIAPVLLAKVFGSKKPKLTIGNDEEVGSIIQELGALHQPCAANEICIDERLKLITTPAYMYDNAPLGEIYQGIYSCLERTVKML